MSSKKEYILEDFKKEIWLYLDNDLPETRMLFWQNEIENNEEVKKHYLEIVEITNVIEDNSEINLADDKFNSIIENVTNHKQANSFFNKINFFNEEQENPFGKLKLAFASTLSVAAILFLMLSQNPNPVKEISQELLDWDATSLNNRMDDFETTVYFTDANNKQDFIDYKISQGAWRQDVQVIQNRILKLKTEFKNKSF